MQYASMSYNLFPLPLLLTSPCPAVILQNSQSHPLQQLAICPRVLAKEMLAETTSLAITTATCRPLQLKIKVGKVAISFSDV